MSEITIYKCAIVEIDGVFRFVDPFEQIVPEESLYCFKFDKIIRIDMLEDKKIMFISNDKQRLEDFYCGLSQYYYINMNGVGTLKIDEAGNQSVFNKNGEETIPLVRKCNICKGDMQIRSYMNKDRQTKYIDFCPECDK